MKKDKIGRLMPYCWLKPRDSIRVYFNKGNPDERHITYKVNEFKPRSIYDPDEYVFERISDGRANFYYTFTNEDYENAIKHQNATPTLIPKCQPRTPCETEGGVICYGY